MNFVPQRFVTRWMKTANYLDDGMHSLLPFDEP